ncbi:MAG: nitrogenase-stabilizing/protective protein NifW [Magnetospirillum sp. WYHS-4]
MCDARLCDVRKGLKDLSAAEDFFRFFEVPFEQHRLDVARLHILKRMADYLHLDNTDSMDDATLWRTCKETLERAYRDFEVAGPLESRGFKVLRQATGFVPLSSLHSQTKS